MLCCKVAYCAATMQVTSPLMTSRRVMVFLCRIVATMIASNCLLGGRHYARNTRANTTVLPMTGRGIMDHPFDLGELTGTQR